MRAGIDPASEISVCKSGKHADAVHRLRQVRHALHQKRRCNHRLISGAGSRTHLSRIVPQRIGQIALQSGIIGRINAVCQTVVIIAGVADQSEYLTGIGIHYNA